MSEIETVAQLLGWSEKGYAEQQEMLNGSDGFKVVREKLVDKGPMLVDMAPASTWRTLGDVLDVRLCDIVGWAWNTRRALLAYCDPAKYPPADVINHTLKHQDITWGRKPRLRVYFDETFMAEVEFTLAVTLAIDGGVLEIKNGRIMGGRLGKCRGQGSLKCESAVLLDPKTKEFDFPAFSFGGGMAIKKAPTAAPTPSA